MSSPRIRVEVVYAQAEQQALRRVELDAGATAADALAASGLCNDFPALAPSPEQFGRHGRLIGREALLSDGDRIEILRPLVADPREARRRNATRSARGGKSSGSP